MSSFENLCRVCANPADHNIFAKIPPYLHGNPNEYLKWQRPIYHMLNDTTGLKITQNDGLPENICAICISYMKHAVTFHDRVINNESNLKAIQILTNAHNSKINDSDKKNQLQRNEDNIYNIQDQKLININQKGICKINKELFNKIWHTENLNPPSVEEITEFLRYVAINIKPVTPSKRPYKNNYKYKKFNYHYQQNNNQNNYYHNNRNYPSIPEEKEYGIEKEEIIDDRNIVSATENECLFGYSEITFEEDNIMESSTLKTIIVEPEDCIERKCRACKNRYLYQRSFLKHLKVCAEYEFLILIEKLNLLLDIRQRKALSPHEYIRRVIFCIRTTCNWLNKNCEEGLTLPDPTSNHNCMKIRGKEDDEVRNRLEISEIKKNIKIQQKQDNMRLLQENNNVTSQENMSSLRPIQSPPPVSPQTALLRPEPRYMPNFTSPPANLLPIPNMNSTKVNTKTAYSSATYCGICSIQFENVAYLEIHNAQKHSKQKN